MFDIDAALDRATGTFDVCKQVTSPYDTGL